MLISTDKWSPGLTSPRWLKLPRVQVVWKSQLWAQCGLLSEWLGSKQAGSQPFCMWWQPCKSRNWHPIIATWNDSPWWVSGPLCSGSVRHKTISWTCRAYWTRRIAYWLRACCWQVSKLPFLLARFGDKCWCLHRDMLAVIQKRPKRQGSSHHFEIKSTKNIKIKMKHRYSQNSSFAQSVCTNPIQLCQSIRIIYSCVRHAMDATCLEKLYGVTPSVKCDSIRNAWSAGIIISLCQRQTINTAHSLFQSIFLFVTAQ